MYESEMKRLDSEIEKCEEPVFYETMSQHARWVPRQALIHNKSYMNTYVTCYLEMSEVTDYSRSIQEELREVVEQYKYKLLLSKYCELFPELELKTVRDLKAFTVFNDCLYVTGKRFSYIKYCGYLALPLVRVLPEELVRAVLSYL